MIKKRVKFIVCFFSKLFETFISVLKVIIFSSFRTSVRSIKGGQECYILGNGPSLKKHLLEDIEILKVKELFVVNDFVRSEFYEVLKPKFYVFADPVYWDESTYSEFRSEALITLNLIKEKTNWPMKILVPSAAIKSGITRHFFDTNVNISIFDYDLNFVTGFDSVLYFLYKRNLGHPSINNVLGTSIFLALTMNFKTVNILGSDHSWLQEILVNNKNEVCHKDAHFFIKGEGVRYYPFRTVFGNSYKMHEILIDYSRMFNGYHLLRKYSDYLNINVFNLCQESFIDAFERKDFNK